MGVNTERHGDTNSNHLKSMIDGEEESLPCSLSPSTHEGESLGQRVGVPSV